MAEPNLIAHKAEGSPAAIVFVHGFASRGLPFSRFPEELASEPGLEGWDFYTLSYATGLLPDLRGLWRADPSIDVLSTYLRTQTELEPLGAYGGVALIAHSMGGLVCQRALLDDPGLADRVSHLIMFGTPSDGLRKARWGRFLKRQIGDMAEGGEFIRDLRRRWRERFGEHRPFELCVVAGDQDSFVPPESSLGPFPAECRVVVPGDHLQIVDVTSPDSMSCRVATRNARGRRRSRRPLELGPGRRREHRLRPRDPRARRARRGARRESPRRPRLGPRSLRSASGGDRRARTARRAARDRCHRGPRWPPQAQLARRRPARRRPRRRSGSTPRG